MPTIRFTDNIQRHVRCPAQSVPGTTLRAALVAYFRTHDRARGYVLDDQGRLRHHMAAFIDGRQIADREHLTDAVGEESVIDIFQALSGG